jgi:aryl-alcohol dehydrogenase-like predicted oxidoreductase
LARLQTDRLDLLQVHNLRGFEELWPQLNEWKKAQKIRYIGTTTSFANDHAKLGELMRKYPLDFIQVDYSIANRDAATTLLPTALERKIAVIVNVPLGGRGGANLTTSGDRPLPPFAAQLGVTDWAQLMLKYVVSHPAVTCTIPGSTKVAHLEDNQAAGRGTLPDAALRRRIEHYWDSLG